MLMGIQSPPDKVTVSGIVLNAADHTPLAGASVLEVCYVGFRSQGIKLKGETSLRWWSWDMG